MNDSHQGALMAKRQHGLMHLGYFEIFLWRRDKIERGNLANEGLFHAQSLLSNLRLDCFAITLFGSFVFCLHIAVL